MVLTVESVSDPRWGDENHTQIICNVKYEKYDISLPVNVMDGDATGHIQQLWERLTGGDYGEIAPYEAPPPAPVRFVKGSDFRAVLKMHHVVDGTLTINASGEISLWNQITAFVSAAISAGVVQMLNVDEQLRTSERFDRQSKGIVDMIEYLPMIDESIADQVFAASHALEVGA